MKITLIAAVADNGVIGKDNGIPWRLSSDFAHFKATTMGKPMIMGHKTWKSLGCRALPGRHHIVITRQPEIEVREQDRSRVVVASNLFNALGAAGQECFRADLDEVFVIGRDQVYGTAMNLADRLVISHIPMEVDGDVFFPTIDPLLWRIVNEVAPEGREIDYVIRYYERV